MQLNEGQKIGLAALESESNVFLTGQAGVGKTTLIKSFLEGKNPRRFPVIAPTGVAALLAGGRTAHSAFGLKTMAGDDEDIIAEVLSNDKVCVRLESWKGFLLDEVSMVDARMFNIMERIAREVRGTSEPWGGLRVVAVGDFAQLPPVDVNNRREKSWAFKSSAWKETNFQSVMLTEIMRTTDSEFIEILNFIRRGIVNERVKDFLNAHLLKDTAQFEGTRLFGKRVDVDRYNLQKLRELPSTEVVFDTQYEGSDYDIERIKKTAPLGERITLKSGALVMIRVNDPDGDYVNGSLGWVESCSQWSSAIEVRLMNPSAAGVDRVWLEPFTFEMKNGEGRITATATNFPVSLAYAMTIHKTQGATLDKVLINANDFWEVGQCYVALSRVKSPQGLFLQSWSPSSIKADREVMAFYDSLNKK
jgi:ATP-dependent DNA helicase PIF1